MLDAGLHSLVWFIEIGTDAEGRFSPVGNRGWHPRGCSRARFDQQPTEALDAVEVEPATEEAGGVR